MRGMVAVLMSLVGFVAATSCATGDDFEKRTRLTIVQLGQFVKAGSDGKAVLVKRFQLEGGEGLVAKAFPTNSRSREHQAQQAEEYAQQILREKNLCEGTVSIDSQILGNRGIGFRYIVLCAQPAIE